MAKKNTIIVIMRSTESRHFRTAVRPRKAEKLRKKMYDPVVRKHVEYEEKNK